MNLIFKSSEGFVEFTIDRKNKKVILKTEQTNYEPQEVEWRMLWDRCLYHTKNLKSDNLSCPLCKRKEEEQDKIAEPLSDQGFKDMLEKQMIIYGYTLENGDSGT